MTRFQSLTAIDGSPEMLAVARQRLAGYGSELGRDGPVQLAAGRNDTRPFIFPFWLSDIPPGVSSPSGERSAAQGGMEVECSSWHGSRRGALRALRTRSERPDGANVN